MTSYGVVLRKLRQINQQPLKLAAKAIGRSAGWLSEIENSRGAARIGPDEFERIVEAYGGQKYRKQFGIWVAQAHKAPAGEQILSFDGAILCHLRKKANLSLDEAALICDLSGPHLCNLEKGKRKISHKLRDRLMRAYGYSPSSFKNFATEDKRGKNIPVRHKLEILLNHLGPSQIESVFGHALSLQIVSTATGVQK